MEGPRQSRSQSPNRSRSFKDTGQTKVKDNLQNRLQGDSSDKAKDTLIKQPKDALPDKANLSARSLSNIPLPKKANQLPRWSNSTYAITLEKSTYHVACESLWAQDFVILPKTKKIRLARLATFSTRLRPIITMLLKADVESTNSTMDASSLCDMLTLGDIEMPDHSGWMVDLSVNPSKRCWCVLADMILCIFPDSTSGKALKVIMLPGLEVKAVVYKSARQEMLPQGPSSSSGNTDTVGKTISGMLRYQVLLSDPCLGAEHVFGVERQEEVDRWVTLFKVAVNLDVDVFTDSESETDDNGNPCSSSAITISEAATNGNALPADTPQSTKPPEKDPEVNRKANVSSSECQRSKSPSRIPRFRSASSPTDSEIIIRKNKSSSYLPSSPAHRHRPLRTNSYDTSHSNNTAISKLPSKDSVFEESPKIFSKIPRSGASSIGSTSSLASDLGSQTRPLLVSRSADSSCPSSKAKSDESSSTKLSRSTDFDTVEPPGSPLMNLLRKARGRASSMSSVKVDPPDKYRQRTSSTSSSTSTSSANSESKISLGLRAKLVRKASTIRVRVFGASNKGQQEVVMLSSLKDVKISGYLSVKNMLKWTSFWCVVSHGTLYSFYTQSPSDTPELVLPLNECTIQLVTNEKNKRHLFKISHLTTRSIHFAAKDNLELSKWVFALKRESKSSAARSSQDQAQLPSGGEFRKHIMGSQLSLDSSASVQSHASMVSRGSLVSENSTTSQSSSLSSLSQQSSSSLGSGGSPKDQTVPLGDLYQHTKCMSGDGPQKVPELKVDTCQGDHSTSEISVNSSNLSQAVCSAHGLKEHEITSPNGVHKKGQKDGTIEEHHLQSMNLEGKVNGPESESTDLAVVSSKMNSSQSIDSGRGDSVSDDSRSAVSVDSRNLTRSLQNVTVSLSAKYSASPHKNNIQQPWRNDKTYQLHLLKAKISTLPDRPAIFNRHLPGPNNEGLLMVSDVGNDVNSDVIPYNGSKVTTAKKKQQMELQRQMSSPTFSEEETVTRKPSVKVKRRFSLKRMNSLRENRPKYTRKPNRDFESEPEPKPVQPIIEPKVEPTVEPKTKTHTEPKVEPGTDLEPNMIEKPMEGGLEVNIDSRRRRSLSDGQLPVSIQQARDAQGQGHVKVRSHVEVAIPARDLTNVSRVGYLERKLDAEWISSWFVLKDNTLYQYAQPIDDVTQDVLQLPGYEVIPCLPAGHRHVFELIHAEQPALVLSTDTVADCEIWMEAVHIATQKLTLDSLNLDMTNSVDQEAAKVSRERLEEEARKQWQKELLRLKKQQLLREVLLQKEELTRRQHQFARSKPSSFDGPHVEEELEEMDEQFLRERALLKQRKVSTQLKLEMVQKQMQASTLARTKTKRKGFKLKGLKSDKNDHTTEIVAITPDKDTLQNQLKVLTEELSNITHELELTERKSGSSSHLSSFSSSSHRKQTFAMSSNASVDSESSRERTQSDFSETRMNRSFASDPNLLHPTPASSSLSLQRPDSVFSPDSMVLDRSSDAGSRAQLLSSNKQGSNMDIPMIDETPSPQETPRNCRNSRHSWDLGASTPFFLTTPPVSYNPGGSNRLGMGGQNPGLNKSCDFSVLQCQDGGRAQTPYSSSQNTVPRRNDAGCLRKCEISASALAEIAAFEDLVQKKMHLPSPVQ